MHIVEGLLRVKPLTPNYRLEEIDVWEVFVKYVKYDRSIIHSWFFDNKSKKSRMSYHDMCETYLPSFEKWKEIYDEQ